MDIDATIKVNELAKDLLKKGLVPSSEEASELAERMIQKGAIPKSKKSSDKGADYEKYLIFLERTERKINHELNSLKGQISSVKSELSVLRGDVNHIKLNKPVEKIEKQQKLVEGTEEPIKEQPKQESKAGNQRQGDFKPGDVSIEKIFYCGNKEQN